MYEMTNDQATLPWYKQGWPWFLISLPASAVIGGIATIVIATHSPNALVVDDYYKQGLAINQETRRLQTATELGISGLLRADSDTVQLEMTVGEIELPKQLTVKFVHATRAELDQSVVVKHTGGRQYQSTYPGLHSGNWYVRLKPEGFPWELRGKAFVDDGMQIRLSGIQVPQ